jgi:serine O-acetyltransferase
MGNSANGGEQGSGPAADLHEAIERAADNAVEALARGGPLLGGTPPPRALPNPLVAARQVQQLRVLLFPELSFAADGAAPSGRDRLVFFLRDLVELLSSEGHLQCYGAAEHSARCQPCVGSALERALLIAAELPSVRALLETDVEASLDGDPAARSAEEIILCYPGFHAVATYRVAHRLWHRGATLVARMLAEQSHASSGIDIHPAATIGPRFFIDHGTGVVIGETATIGENVRLYQGVTIGARSLPKGQAQRLRGAKRHPTLEDGVIAYANATILGGDTVIGRNALIGANAWVTSSVPPGGRVSMAATSPSP